ncbi:MAG: bacterial Ig-like domain-containing protein [Clostridia bacterium]|nr:bacterial Ig-like domain-containing protein [Clostridia bacterium]
MRIIRLITILLFVISVLAYIGTTVYNRKYVDHTPPVIRCDSTELELSVNHTDADLLKGLTATDDRDGDLTDQIMIRGVTNLITNDTAQVNYVVFDNSNNMANLQRTLHYTDYEAPHFTLSKPLVFPIGETVTLLDRLQASDVIDGDISDSIRITAQNINTNYIGLYSLTVQVTNSMGDISGLTLPVRICDNNKRADISLKEYIVYLEKGATFDPKDYLAKATDAAGDKVSPDKIRIQSTVNTEKADTYNVAYSYQSETVFLTVVVR